MSSDANATAGEAVSPPKIQIHPLAALSEAQFDNEMARQRRLLLAQQVYELTQLTDRQAKRIAQLEAELETTQQANGA